MSKTVNKLCSLIGVISSILIIISYVVIRASIKSININEIIDKIVNQGQNISIVFYALIGLCWIFVLSVLIIFVIHLVDLFYKKHVSKTLLLVSGIGALINMFNVFPFLLNVNRIMSLLSKLNSVDWFTNVANLGKIVYLGTNIVNRMELFSILFIIVTASNIVYVVLAFRNKFNDSITPENILDSGKRAFHSTTSYLKNKINKENESNNQSEYAHFSLNYILGYFKTKLSNNFLFRYSLPFVGIIFIALSILYAFNLPIRNLLILSAILCFFSKKLGSLAIGGFFYAITLLKSFIYYVYNSNGVFSIIAVIDSLIGALIIAILITIYIRSDFFKQMYSKASKDKTKQLNTEDGSEKESTSSLNQIEEGNAVSESDAMNITNANAIINVDTNKEDNNNGEINKDKAVIIDVDTNKEDSINEEINKEQDVNKF